MIAKQAEELRAHTRFSKSLRAIGPGFQQLVSPACFAALQPCPSTMLAHHGSCGL